jgi:hypothetical protein
VELARPSELNDLEHEGGARHRYPAKFNMTLWRLRRCIIRTEPYRRSSCFMLMIAGEPGTDRASHVVLGFFGRIPLYALTETRFCDSPAFQIEIASAGPSNPEAYKLKRRPAVKSIAAQRLGSFLTANF